MNIKKFFVNCYCALIWNREKRRRTAGAFSCSIAPQAPPSPNEEFVPVEDLLGMGGIDWATYLLSHNLLSHNMPEKVVALRRGLDDESNRLLDLIFARMRIFPKNSRWTDFKIRHSNLWSLITPRELEDHKTYSAEWSQYCADFPMDAQEYDHDVFLYHYGLKKASDKLKKYIAGKDFIDGGSYIGDTALLFLKRYSPRRVYSFEISEKTCARYENTMRINNILADQYKLCHMGLSNGKSEIMMNDSAHQGTSILYGGSHKVQLTDLDSFVQENNLRVGFIKADVEGVGLEAVLGMAETIKRDRPVLNIAIYHNPKEFFEIKPALDEITAGLDYKMTIAQYNPCVERFLGISVFAYPKELE